MVLIVSCFGLYRFTTSCCHRNISDDSRGSSSFHRLPKVCLLPCQFTCHNREIIHPSKCREDSSKCRSHELREDYYFSEQVYLPGCRGRLVSNTAGVSTCYLRGLFSTHAIFTKGTCRPYLSLGKPPSSPSAKRATKQMQQVALTVLTYTRSSLPQVANLVGD